MEVRDLLSEYDFDGDNTPIVVGSAKYPKIKIGSKIIFSIAPISCVNIVKIVLPVD